MLNLTQTAADVRQFARVLTGDNVKLGDVIRINANKGGGHAVVLHISGTTMHVTGFYEDGERWWDFVQMADARHATPYQINKLVRVANAAGIEMALIQIELAGNIAEAAWETAQAAG
jgi:hypothetical protein